MAKQIAGSGGRVRACMVLRVCACVGELVWESSLACEGCVGQLTLFQGSDKGMKHDEVLRQLVRRPRQQGFRLRDEER